MTIDIYSLSEMIKNGEERLMSYKKQLEEVSRDKNTYFTDDFIIWFKAHLRDCKNNEELLLKKNILEKTNENQGLNPPYCYKK